MGIPDPIPHRHDAELRYEFKASQLAQIIVEVALGNDPAQFLPHELDIHGHELVTLLKEAQRRVALLDKPKVAESCAKQGAGVYVAYMWDTGPVVAFQSESEITALRWSNEHDGHTVKFWAEGTEWSNER